MFVYNDEIASFLAFDINAFNFLLEKMGLNNKINENSLFENNENTSLNFTSEEQVTNAKYIKN